MLNAFRFAEHPSKTYRYAEAIASLERSDKLKPAVPEVAVALARLSRR